MVNMGLFVTSAIAGFVTLYVLENMIGINISHHTVGPFMPPCFDRIFACGKNRAGQTCLQTKGFWGDARLDWCLNGSCAQANKAVNDAVVAGKASYPSGNTQPGPSCVPGGTRGIPPGGLP